MFDLAKVGLILRLARDSPSEFCERTIAAADRYLGRWGAGHVAHESIDFDQMLALLDEKLPTLISEMLHDPGLEEIEQTVSARARELRGKSPFPPYENADAALARFCYLACRALKPLVVLETGVASGITSAFILRALSLNGNGDLWSIDLPPLAENARFYVGAVVPPELKTRWHLQIGTSRRILPQLLPQLGEVGIFLHDSLHTYRNMQAEFLAVWPFLQPGGLLVADDIDFNRALANFAHAKSRSSWYEVQEKEKKSHFGVIIKEQLRT